MEEATYWKKCNVCKKPIGLNQKYFICSVSTCNQKRTGLSFCSLNCFESHLPFANHKTAGAVEKVAPSTPEAVPAEPRRIIVSSSASSPGGTSFRESQNAGLEDDVLIVASKLKQYIRAKSDMNTSAEVMNVLSDKVRRLCDDAIDQARAEGRKTVLDRDFR